jgi:hypothetical protein
MFSSRQWSIRLPVLLVSLFARPALASVAGDEANGIIGFVMCLLATLPTAPDLCAAVEGCALYMYLPY